MSFRLQQFNIHHQKKKRHTWRMESMQDFVTSTKAMFQGNSLHSSVKDARAKPSKITKKLLDHSIKIPIFMS